MQTVIETPTGYMIRCPACQWHEFPKNGRPGAHWVFDGNYQRPTFTPSMNSIVNGPGPHHQSDHPTTRCHFIITAGNISFCADCTHPLAGKTMALEPFAEAEVRSYAAMLPRPPDEP